MAKAYNLTFDYILYKMSFANVRLYNAVLPSFSAKKDGKKDTGTDLFVDIAALALFSDRDYCDLLIYRGESVG